MKNPPPPTLTLDNYRDAIAICRATLAGDEAGLLALARSCDPTMTFQALVRLHLRGLLAQAGGHVDIVDRFLAGFLASTTDLEDDQ